MRFVAPILLSCLVPAAALADSGVTIVDDEPMSQKVAAAPSDARPAAPHAPADVGQLRSARVAAPSPVTLGGADAAVAREHDVAPPHAVESSATNGEIVAELAARQLARETRRHQRAIDACLSAAHRRAPAAAGSLTLDFDVADRKLKSVVVSDDGLHDAQLSACLTSAARSFSFTLAAARFRWPVAVR